MGRDNKEIKQMMMRSLVVNKYLSFNLNLNSTYHMQRDYTSVNNDNVTRSQSHGQMGNGDSKLRHSTLTIGLMCHLFYYFLPRIFAYFIRLQLRPAAAATMTAAIMATNTFDIETAAACLLVACKR